MGNLHLDFVALYGKEGKLLYSSHRLGETLPWPANAQEAGNPFASHIPIVSGPYLFEDLPVILSSQLFTRNNGVGPAVGRLIFGKALDKSVLHEIEELSSLPKGYLIVMVFITVLPVAVFFITTRLFKILRNLNQFLEREVQNRTS